MSILPKNLPPDAVPHSTTPADQALVENRPSPTETAETSETAGTAGLPCPLLGLSAELRNKIWELAYTIEVNPRQKTDLLTATGPSYALLATCRQIKVEATGFFRESHVRYWEGNQFELKRTIQGVRRRDETPGATLQGLRALKDRGIELIERMEFTLDEEHAGRMIRGVVIADTEDTAWWIHKAPIRAYGSGADGLCLLAQQGFEVDWNIRSCHGTFGARMGRHMQHQQDSPSMSTREKYVQVWEALLKYL